MIFALKMMIMSRHHPVTAYRQEGFPGKGEIQFDRFHLCAGLLQFEGRLAAAGLDLRIDPDAGDIRAVGQFPPAEVAVSHRCHKIPPGSGLGHRGERAGASDRLEHQGDIPGGARHRAGD